MVLEPPSEVTLAHKYEAEEKALLPGRDPAPADAPTERPLKKRKGPKGPNPLSVKKKKKSKPPTQFGDDAHHSTGDKRKREAANDNQEHEDGPRKRKRRRRTAAAGDGDHQEGAGVTADVA